MEYLNFILLFSFGISMVTAGTRYIAFPVDNIDIIEVNQVIPQRIPRHTEAYASMALADRTNKIESQLPRIERSSQIFDYVDYGAQTGIDGAFSWHADYPAHP